MKKIFLNDLIIKINDNICVDGDIFHHLARVLRVRKNERFVLQDKDKNEFNGIISRIDKDSIVFNITDIYARNKRICPCITIMFGLLKGDKNELLLQKCTEAGADRFIPVITANCIADCGNNSEKKLLRFRNIVKEASMQSLREKIPEVSDIIYFKDIKEIDNASVKYFGLIKNDSLPLYECLNQRDHDCGIVFFAGPEGDFTDKEILRLESSGFYPVKLSDYILRSETSAVYFTSAIHAYYYKKS